MVLAAIAVLFLQSGQALTQGAPSISIAPDEGVVGTLVIATGTGFAAGEAVSVAFDGVVATTTAADGNGAWQAVFSVPVAAVGSLVVDASGPETDASDVAEFTFTSSGPPGPCLP